MGRSFIASYVGAYFKADMPNEEFRAKLNEENFIDNLDEQFLRPYEGLENDPVLLPFNKDEKLPAGIYSDAYEESISEVTPEMIALFTENLKKTYLAEIADMKAIFGDKLNICFGVVRYRDEMG